MTRKLDAFDLAAEKEGKAIRRSNRIRGPIPTKAKAKGKKMLNRDNFREFDDLFNDAIILKREVIAA